MENVYGKHGCCYATVKQLQSSVEAGQVFKMTTGHSGYLAETFNKENCRASEIFVSKSVK